MRIDFADVQEAGNERCRQAPLPRIAGVRPAASVNVHVPRLAGACATRLEAKYVGRSCQLHSRRSATAHADGRGSAACVTVTKTRQAHEAALKQYEQDTAELLALRKHLATAAARAG